MALSMVGNIIEYGFTSLDGEMGFLVLKRGFQPKVLYRAYLKPAARAGAY
jgi:hypothetical protein